MKVKVWNRNVHPFKGVFKGDEVFIPAGHSMEMDYEEAVEMKGTMVMTPKKGGDDQWLPETMQILEIDTGGAEIKPILKTTFDCNLCKESFQTERSLMLHSEDAHKTEIMDEDHEHAPIEAKKRGRPPKTQAAS